MDDLTKRLVEALKAHHSKVVHTMQIPNNCPTCAPIIEAEVQRRMEERWIPVTERLPEEMTEVLATGHEWDDKVSGKRFYLVVRFNNSNFHQWVCDDSEDGGYWPESDNVYVTHWQPLPEAPKGAKHE